MGYLYERLREVSDAAQMTVYCSLCPKWEATGTAAETRDKARKHRETRHPELATKTKIVRKKRSFSSSLTAEREAQIEEERRQRMRALGLI